MNAISIITLLLLFVYSLSLCISKSIGQKPPHPTQIDTDPPPPCSSPLSHLQISKHKYKDIKFLSIILLSIVTLDFFLNHKQKKFKSTVIQITNFQTQICIQR